MQRPADDFDPNERHGLEIRYTAADVEVSENEAESENEGEEDSLNPNPNGSISKPPIEQFTLDSGESGVYGHERGRSRGGIAVVAEDDPNTRCGFGGFSPTWMQKFASKKSFMAVFSLLAVVQGMSWAYFTATITTLEKRFKISSQTAGIVMTGNEISQVLFSVVIAYYGSHGHRPRWIAVGVLFSAMSCLLLASPHLFYGAGQDALSLTEEYQDKFNVDVAHMTMTSMSPAGRAKRSANFDWDHDEDENDDIFKEDELLKGDVLSIPTFTTIGRLEARLQNLKEGTPSPAKFATENNDSMKKNLPPISAQNAGVGIKTATTNTPSREAKRAESQSAKRNMVQLCRRETEAGGGKGDGCEAGETSVVPLLLIFISQFVAGIGVLLFFSLGGPYLDDNIKKTQSPMLFGVTMSLRLIGPTLGFIFGSICLKMYIAPSLTPIIQPGDPRWLGAWWLGWVVLGILMCITSFFIALFPRVLPREAKRRIISQVAHSQQVRRSSGLLTVSEKTGDMIRSGSQLLFTAELTKDNPIPKLSEMSKAVKSLLRNKINLYNNLSGVFYIFSAIGYWTYMPKYMETIFMQTAANAALVSGFVSIAFQAAGLLISGALISKFQPSARKLAGWNVFLGFLYVIVKIGFTQMGCNDGRIAHGEVDGEANSWNLTMPCNQDCNCKVNKMLPFCYKENQTVYYSACHAGCTLFSNGTASNCSCLPDPIRDNVTLGSCSEGCFQSFVIFLVVNAVIKLLDSSGRIGNMLVSYRCVDPKDKSLAIGLAIFLISIFAMLPAPIVFGAIIDSVCLVWGTKCGGKGNCWLYDGQQLRYVFNLTAAAFTFLGAAFDCLVWYHVEGLDLYDEEKNVAAAKAKRDKAIAGK